MWGTLSPSDARRVVGMLVCESQGEVWEEDEVFPTQ